MVSPSFSIATQIRLILSQLSKKTYKTSSADLGKIVRQYGDDARLYVLRCLVQDLDFVAYDASVSRDQQKMQLLTHELSTLTSRANFAALVARALDAGNTDPSSASAAQYGAEWFTAFARHTSLSLSARLLIAAAVADSVATQQQQKKPSSLTAASVVDVLDALATAVVAGGAAAAQELSVPARHAFLYCVHASPLVDAAARARLLTRLQPVLGDAAITSDLTLAPQYAARPDGVTAAANTSSNADAATAAAATAATAATPAVVSLDLTTRISASLRLADVLRDIGTTCVTNSDMLADVLQRYGGTHAAVDDVELCGALVMMCSTRDVGLVASGAGVGAGDVHTRARVALPDSHALASSSSSSAAAAAAAATSTADWDIAAFCKAVKSVYPKTDWTSVFAALPRLPPGSLSLSSPASLTLLLDTHATLTKQSATTNTFPLSLLLSPYADPVGQLSLLRHLIVTPSAPLMTTEAIRAELTSSSSLPPRVDFASLAIVAPVPSAHKRNVPAVWFCPAFVLSLLTATQRAGSGCADPWSMARAVLQPCREAYPEEVLLAVWHAHALHLTQSSSSSSSSSSAAAAASSSPAAANTDALADVVGHFMLRAGGQASAARPTLSVIWTLDRTLFVRWMHTLHQRDPCSAPRLLDVAVELNDPASLTTVLDADIVVDAAPVPFALDMACVAHRRGLVDLEAWLTIRMTRQRAAASGGVATDTPTTAVDVLSVIEYVASCTPTSDNIDAINRLAAKAATSGPPTSHDQLLGRRALSIDCMHVMFKVLLALKADRAMMTATTEARLASLYANCCLAAPQLLQNSVDDIESEANTYFQKIYSKKIELPEVVAMLQKFKTAGDEGAATALPSRRVDAVDVASLSPALRHQREVYACMIHTLFDEYRFFHKYPSKELRITGELFGLLIQHRLVSSFTLGVALQCVYEAVCHARASKMYKFGVWALEQFMPRLAEWPQYCAMLTLVPDLCTAHPELDTLVRRVVRDAPAERIVATSVPSVMGAGAAGTAVSGMGTPAGGKAPLPAAGDALRSVSAAPSSANALSHTNAVTGSPSLRSPQPTLTGAPISRTVSDATLSSTFKDKDGAVSKSPSVGNLSNAFGSSLSIDTLLHAENDKRDNGTAGPELVLPPEEVQDKIHFLINNVSKVNMRAKAKEFRQLIRPEWYRYFARYLVVKRVSIEAKYQIIYAQFLGFVALPALRKVLINTTYDNIDVLLRSDKVLVSASERSLLKNLGSWLGLLTISINKPILRKRLHLKKLVLDGYDTGRLIALIPFIAKVLESCAQSKVFVKTNPWLAALVALLREIFDLEGLKLNLKFEIEVLFNTLSIKMKDVTASMLLKDRRITVNPNNNLNFRDAKMAAAAGLPSQVADAFAAGSLLGDKAGSTGNLGAIAAAAQATTGSFPATGATTGQQSQFIIPNLPAFVAIHPSVTLFNVYPHLKRCVPTAVDRAIREIIVPVVERSVTIACVTARELVLKDFAMEPDETKMRKAAHQIVQHLTSSLALVTCKEPLRVSISNQLGSLLEANSNANERQFIEQACMQVAADNLELGCKLIEKAASDRAVHEIDEALAPMYAVRRKHREQTAQPYYDMSIFSSGGRYPAALPDVLRPKPNIHGLSQAQLQLYDDFARPRIYQNLTNAPSLDVTQRRGTATGTAADGTTTTADGQVAADGASGDAAAAASPVVPGAASAVSGVAAPSSQRTLDKLVACLGQLEQAVSRYANAKNTTLAQLEPSQATPGTDDAQQAAGSQVLLLLRMVPVILTQVPTTGDDASQFSPDVVAFTFAHKVFKRLYERDCRHSLLQIQVHIQVLLYIRAACSGNKLIKEITTWLLFAKDERKYLLEITSSLLRARLLSIPDVDVHMAELVAQHVEQGQGGGPRLDFMVNLVGRVIVKERTVQPSEFAQLLDALTKVLRLAQERRNKPLMTQLSQLLEEVRSLSSAPAVGAGQPGYVGGQPTDWNRVTSTDGSVAGGDGGIAGADGVTAVPGGVSAPVSDLATVVGTMLPPLSGADAAQYEHEPDELDHELFDLTVAEQAASGDTLQLRQHIVFLLDEWMSICLQGTASDKTYAQYLRALQQQSGVLHTPHSTRRFFRIVTQLCIENSLKSAVTNPQTVNANGERSVQQLSYTAVDALAKLVVFLVKFLDLSQSHFHKPNNADSESKDGKDSKESKDAAADGKAEDGKDGTAAGADGKNGYDTAAAIASKVGLLTCFLDVCMRVLRRDCDVKKSTGLFNQRPYIRLLSNLLHDMNTPDPALDSNNSAVLLAFARALRLVRPQRVPGFCFAWLELVSHRALMSKLLLSKSPHCAYVFEQLLVDLFRFMQPYLRNAQLTNSVRLLYKGALRVLLVLLHDFPEFLCEYHFSFCDVIPVSCIQIRNLILSAFPRNMRLPDPFTPNLKVDLLPEMTQSPCISSDLAATLQQPRHQQLLQNLDNYLAYRSPATFHAQLLSSLYIVTPAQLQSTVPAEKEKANMLVLQAGTAYNIPLINSLVLYVGIDGIQKQLRAGTGLVAQFQDNSVMDIFTTLVTHLDAEGRYYVLNAVANQLRFPNNHTHYFSCVLLYVFLQAKQAVVREQITRVLLERLIVHRPHPWGLLITFIELIKNPRYDFWKQPFTRCAPEIERLFESVARSCMPAPAAGQPGAPAVGADGKPTGAAAATPGAPGGAIGGGSVGAQQQQGADATQASGGGGGGGGVGGGGNNSS